MYMSQWVSHTLSLKYDLEMCIIFITPAVICCTLLHYLLYVVNQVYCTLIIELKLELFS